MVRLSRVRGSGRCGEQLVMGGHDNHAAGSLSTLHQQFLLPGAAHILVSSSALARVAVQQRCLVHHHCWFISETVSEIMSQASHRTDIVYITSPTHNTHVTFYTNVVSGSVGVEAALAPCQLKLR